MKKNSFTRKKLNTLNGFTLIELLVVISIMAVLLALSIYGMQEARKASRDGQRKANLEQIRSGLEMYKADCNSYPTALVADTSLVGSGTPSTCAKTNTYISKVPKDPLSTASHSYIYYSDGTIYQLCAAMEQGGTTVTCGSSSDCGGTTCNYQVVNP